MRHENRAGEARVRRLALIPLALALLVGSALGADAGPTSAGRLRLVSRQGHSGQVTSVVLGADNSLALTAGTDRQVILWEVFTGVPLRHFHVRGPLNSAAFGQDNRVIVAADGTAAVVWDARTGGLVARLVHHTKPLSALELSADGSRLLTTSDDGTAALWVLPSGKPARTFPGPGDLPLSRASMDGSAGRVLTYHSVVRQRLRGELLAEYSAVLWDANTGKKLFELNDATRPLLSVHLAPKGDLIGATHALGVVTIWSASGVKVDEFGPQAGPSLVANLRFDAAGQRALVAWANDSHCVRDIAAQRMIWTFRPGRRPDSAMRAALSPDGKTVVLWNEPDLEFHDIDSAERLYRFSFGFQNRVRDLSISRDSKKAIVGFADGNAGVLETRRSKSIVPLVSATNRFRTLAVDERGVRSVTQEADGGLDVTIPAFLDWPLTGPVTTQNLAGDRFQKLNTSTRLLLMNAAGDRLLTAGLGNEVAVWELPSCKLSQFSGSSRGQERVTALAFGPNGDIAAGSDGEAFVYSPVKRPVVRLAPISGRVGIVAFSADGRSVFTRADTSSDDTLDIEEAVWDAATGQRLARTPPRAEQVPKVAAAPAPPASDVEPGDGTPVWDAGGSEELVVSNRNGPQRLLPDGRRPKDVLWDDQAGRGVALFPYWTSSFGWNAPAVSPNGVMVATIRNRTVIVWDAQTKALVRKCEPSEGLINAVAFRPDGKVLIGACQDALRTWDVATGQELAVFAVMNHRVNWVEGSVKGVFEVGILPGPQRMNNWLVATRSGRFDTGNVDDGGPFSWVFNDKPFRALPPEMYVRDYFEPRLLIRVLAGETLPPVRSAAELNRAQPRVRVMNVRDGAKTGTVDVAVMVDPIEGLVSRGGRKLTTHTVHDLRLSRDGQLVEQEPRLNDMSPSADTADADLAAWGERTRLRPGGRVVERGATGRLIVNFRGIKLPSTPGRSVAFSAYAFNADRVKSASSAPRTFPVAPYVVPKRGRAYVVCVGVGAKDKAPFGERFDWLHFTPLGARRVRDELHAALKRTGMYDEVTSILLASNDRWEDRTAIRPTKGNIRTVLGLLAGVRDEKGLAQIPRGLRESMLGDVATATPDDLVVLFFSGHGYSHPHGDFYLIPFDSGENAGDDVRPEVLKHSISGGELSHWLAEIDAGDSVLVIDSCNSGAVSPVKPAPLGDRGLGQLAYDKAMRVLAAAQPTGVARGSGELSVYSLVAYTLAVEGLAEGMALHDGRMSLGGLLQFVTDRAPVVWREKVVRQVNQGQLPVLLDFSERKATGDAAK